MVFLLSRIQFGLSIGFHFLFPVTTLGFILFILIFESLYYFKKNNEYKTISSFLVKILGVVFVMGVATGILLPFSIGSNWGRFSLFSGELFGVLLSIESIVAFTLESWFLIILVFGRSRVSDKLYLFSAFAVFFGSYLSAFLIIAANSWMHTPAGFAIVNGKIIITDLFKAVMNPSTLIRFFHTIIASWITGSVVVGAIASYYLLKKRFENLARRMLFSVSIFLILLPITQIVIGHSHIMEVLEYNPPKSAAYEGIFKTQNGASMYIFGIPDAKNEKIYAGVAIPKMLSFLETWTFNSKVKGLEEYPKEIWPPVNVIFTTFHLMVLIGFLLLTLSIFTAYFLYKKKLYDKKWFLRFIIFCFPLPYLAVELGWIGTEIGRQPWMLYNILKTSDSTTLAVNSLRIITTLSILTLIYIFISIFFTIIIKNIIKKGPQ